MCPRKRKENNVKNSDHNVLPIKPKGSTCALLGSKFNVIFQIENKNSKTFYSDSCMHSLLMSSQAGLVFCNEATEILLAGEQSFGHIIMDCFLMLLQVVLCAEWLVTRITRKFHIWLTLVAQMFNKHKFCILATETHITDLASISLTLLE